MTFWTELAGQSFTVEQFDAKGTETRALVKGSGTPVIFLHGVSGHLEAFIPAAARFGAGYELHLIDMLGHGYTTKPGGPLTIDRFTAHVIDYMDARGIAKAHIVGISLGGWVAAWLAAHNSDRVLSTILIAAGGNPSPILPEVGARIRSSTLAAVMSDDLEATRKRVQNVVFKPEMADDEVVAMRFTIYHLPEFRANIEGLLALADPDTYARNALTPDMLGKIEAPTLLIWGESDPYSSGIADADFLVNNVPAVKLVQMSATGHWPPYERPDDFVALATAFLDRGLDAVDTAKL